MDRRSRSPPSLFDDQEFGGGARGGADERHVKEELVREHARVSEDAVSGWEKAEKEAASLRDQLEATARKNSSLEDRVVQLDGALKECLRQLRLSRDQQEERLQDALGDRADQWRSEKFSLEIRILELEAQLETAEKKIARRPLLDALEMENNDLRLKILSLAEQLHLQTVESMKKVSALEAESRRLQALARKPSSGDLTWEIDLMDDFLEMERLVASPGRETRNGSPEAELRDLLERTAELEEKAETAETEKERLEVTQRQLEEGERKAEDLWSQLQMTGDSRAQELLEKVRRLEKNIEEERALSAELTGKCQRLEEELSRKRPESELRRATAAAGKLHDCQKTIASISDFSCCFESHIGSMV
ncbi:unnamed protein product [Spirodela intermedia]|uniref:Uncharacterized protein n=1 Tax=Spirodela intermedia TaxID=51605 RepID=A0A7I8IRK5_SPIIN|nr:unnamed protein product [Spirodela intermedia]CAA6660592.1 unnamed protein product [Spirodela intermedia]